jgi:hypothetical protein
LDQFATRFGGQGEEYIRAYYGLFLLVHGTANLLSVARDRRAKAEMRNNCLAICDALVAHVEVLKVPAGQRRRTREPYRTKAK